MRQSSVIGKMVCFDTDFTVALLQGQSEAIKKAEEIESRGERKTTTPIGAFELFLGANLSKHRLQNIELVNDFLRNLEVLDFDLAAAERAGKIEAELRMSGKPIGIRDSMVAGIALRHEQRIITKNVKHFSQISGLSYESW